MLTIVALALAGAVPAADAGPTTPQQDFDAASAAVAADDCAKAISLFEALERRTAFKSGSLAASAVAVRKGACLVDQKRLGEGEVSILAGVPGLEGGGKSFAVELAEAYVRLGRLSLLRSDFRQAKTRFEKARAQQVEAQRLVILGGLVQATMFDGAAEALALADEGIAQATALSTDAKDAAAAFHTLKGRILLNRGQDEAAYAELMNALRLGGGLTLKTTLVEASMRGDLALAAMLLGRKDEARKYLAYTGAGRIAASPFATAAAMSPPQCGEETGLRPEDFAVVEFGISDDGSVGSARTVYTRGRAEVAAAFAQAVSQWFWRPESLAKIPAFYRLATRVELRCSSAGGPAPGLMKPLSDRFAQWALTNLGDQATEIGRNDATAIERLRRELSVREQRHDAKGQVAAMSLVATIDPRINDQTLAMLDRALAMSGEAGVPAEAVNTLRIYRLLAQSYANLKGTRLRLRKLRRDDVARLLQEPAMASDAVASDTLRLLGTEPGDDLLEEVADDNRLPGSHPLRVLALLTLANRAAGSGDIPRAQALFGRTGLTEQQCALIGPKPAIRRNGVDSGDFPKEAMRYGFEGWVSLEFDISADGAAANTRPVIAYPPFVFAEAARGMAKDFRYETTYRPSGGTPCYANQQTLRFLIQ